MFIRRRLPTAIRARVSPRVLRGYSYHDDAAFGHRVPAKYELPDCESILSNECDTSADNSDTPEELDNRNRNAPLLRFVESVRRHGHRAAQIDPLDLMDRE
jgi:probable 2-oxoglutarate dehydrogenase E1 component DHKTD1